MKQTLLGPKTQIKTPFKTKKEKITSKSKLSLSNIQIEKSIFFSKKNKL